MRARLLPVPVALLAAATASADSVVLENDYVRVARNAAPCASAGPSCGERVLVALGPVRLAGVKPRALARGQIAVFARGESYAAPSGEFLEVAWKAAHPPVQAPAVRIAPEKNELLHDGDSFFVFEEKLQPGETRARHSHAQRVVVVINETRLQQWPDGAAEVLRQQTPDDVRFNPPVVHVVKNVGNVPLRNIVLELKPGRPFKLGTFERQGKPLLGLVLDDALVVDLQAANAALEQRQRGSRKLAMPVSMKELIERYEGELGERLRLIARETAAATPRPGYVHELKALRIRPPVPDPENILNAAVNYTEHETEMARGGALPPAAPAGAAPAARSAPGLWERKSGDPRQNPYLFVKPRSALIAAGEAIRIPPGRDRVDWECELNVVIGKRGHHVPIERARDHIFGYTLQNDVSDRGGRGDARHGSDWLIAKGHDTFAPLGPFIVPKEFIADPQKLGIKFSLSGTLMQDSSTDRMTHSVDEMLHYASNILALRPGDLISTGSPAGVGSARNPPIFMKAGDVATCTIEGVGTLENPVAGAEAAPPAGSRSLAEQPEKVIALLLFPELTLLDLVGPLQVLRGLPPPFRTVVVGEKKEPMLTDTGLALTPERTFAEVPRPFAIVVPGGPGSVASMGNRAIQDYLRTAAPQAEVVGSVCTGALVLGAAGLLEGKRASTHWAYARELERLGAIYVRERFVEDGKLITGGGVSSGIDMALALAARLTDEATARRIQLGIEYDPRPPFGAIDWSKVGDGELERQRLGGTGRRLKDAPQLLAERPDLLQRLGIAKN
jgi:2-keto-4-pentenoate hydratase/2-oxohepta-3-ene-1,7-dioic acid hydratase in catechol pathway/putative intracellular protease/amidase